MKNKINLLFGNEEEFKSLFENDDIEKIIKELSALNKTFVITMGAKGAICINKKDIYRTSSKKINKAKNFYKSISMNPLLVKKELPGYLADRLQEALWREALHIVNQGYANTEDLDRAIEDGPGLRWSLMGIFLTYHLAGGKAGMKHMLEQFGPALKLPWTKLKAPTLSKKLSSRVIKGTKKQARGKSVDKISNIRDEYLVSLLKMRKKFETKLR